MKSTVRQLFICAAIAFFFTLTFAALAQEKSSVAPAPEAVPSTAPGTPAAEPSPAPAAPATPAAPTAEIPPAAPTAPPAIPVPATEPAKSELRRLDAPVTEDAPTPKPPVKKPRVRRPTGISVTPGPHGGDRVRVLNDQHVPAGEIVSGKVVTVMGDLLVDGECQRDVVTVMGDTTINGTVHGRVVTVMGDIVLGPKAKVDGDVFCKGGDVTRDPGATVGGKVVEVAIDDNSSDFIVPLTSWFEHGLKFGRPLAIGPGLGWLWILSAFMIAVYALMALVFPGSIRKCGDTLVHRPVLTIVSSLLGMLALPVVFVLLCVTIIGIPVALLCLPLAVVLAVLFGRAAVYALVGRAITADRVHPAIALLLGAGVFLLLYTVPVLGLMLSLLVAMLGFGCVITTMLTPAKKPTTPAAPPAPARPMAPMPAMAFVASAAPVTPALAPMAAEAPPVASDFQSQSQSQSPSQSAGFVGEAAAFTPPVLPAMAAAQPLPLINASLPRAGFWRRLGAMALDGMLIGIIFGPMGAGPMIMPMLAIYAALMWKLKGTTVGGIVCGLAVVRVDDRPVDWPTAIVRALGCFLSLVVIGLGFVWVAFDDEKQSWHDKIAGTTVVRAPKGVSLV